MAYPDNNFIEINGPQTIMRGNILAGTGTFSGTFKADNVAAINSINIKDGAVAFHMLVHPPSPAYYLQKNASGKHVAGLYQNRGPRTLTFTVEGSPYNSYMQVTMPAIIDFTLPYYVGIRVLKNGVACARSYMSYEGSVQNSYGDVLKNRFLNYFDFDPPTSGFAIYTIELVDIHQIYTLAQSVTITAVPLYATYYSNTRWPGVPSMTHPYDVIAAYDAGALAVPGAAHYEARATPFQHSVYGPFLPGGYFAWANYTGTYTMFSDLTLNSFAGPADVRIIRR